MAPELLAERPPVYEAYELELAPTAASTGGSDEVEERLRNLGYLE